MLFYSNLPLPPWICIWELINVSISNQYTHFLDLISNAQLMSLDSKGGSVIWVNLGLKFQRPSSNSDLQGSYPRISCSLFSYWVQMVNIWRARVEEARDYCNFSSGKTTATWCQALCVGKYLRPKSYLLVVKYLRKHQNIVTSKESHFFVVATENFTHAPELGQG